MSRFVRLSNAAQFRPDKLSKCPLFASERMFCDLYCIASGQVQKPHSHSDADKVYVVLSGEVLVQLGDETRLLRAGEAAHSVAGEVHGIRNDAPTPAQVLVFMTPPPAPTAPAS